MPTRYKRKQTQKYDQKELARRLRFSLLGIFGFIIIGLLVLNFFGPKLGALLGFISVYRNDQGPTAAITVNPPSFAELPDAINQDNIRIEGYSLPSSTVKLFVNGKERAEVLAGDDGIFIFDDVTLIQARNSLFAKTVDEAGNQSDKSETRYVLVDKEEPDIDIESPELGETIRNLNDRVMIRGKVSEEARITINERLVVQKPDLSYEYLLGVSEGDIIITVEAVDEAGNSNKESITINYQNESD